MEKITQYLTPLLLIIFVFVVAIITAPKKNTWKYEIHGKVETEMGPHDAIWYTDTIEFVTPDSCGYHNSDNSLVSVKSPYTLIENVK